MCGAKAIEDTALDFNDDDYDKYRLRREELIDNIVNIVKLQEKQFDFKAFQTDIQDNEFWEGIEEAVKLRTRSFMKVIPYRKLENEKRFELIDKGFDIVYQQRENLQFLIQEIDDEALARALFEVLVGSEYVMVNHYASKRQFKDVVIDNICLQDEDLEYIWDKYTSNIALVEKIAAVRRNIRLEKQLSYLTNRVSYLENLLQLMLDDKE